MILDPQRCEARRERSNQATIVVEQLGPWKVEGKRLQHQAKIDGGHRRTFLPWRIYRRRDHNRSSKIGPTTEMAVNAPKATEAHPIVLCMVDLFSFVIRMLFSSLLSLRHR